MRLLRLFRLFNFFTKLQVKFTKQELSLEMADHMMKMSILTNFIKAHVTSQSEFYRYFVGPIDEPPPTNNIGNIEVAHCMLQSQIHCYQAALLANLHLRDLDAKMLREVNAVRQSKVVAEELEGFVMKAFHKGVVSSREAEAILDPLHDHIKDCLMHNKNTLRGLSTIIRTDSSINLSATAAHLANAESAVGLGDGPKRMERLTTNEFDLEAIQQDCPEYDPDFDPADHPMLEADDLCRDISVVDSRSIKVPKRVVAFHD